MIDGRALNVAPGESTSMQERLAGIGRSPAAKRVALVALTLMLAGLFRWAFHPQHLSFDSYDYMVQSYKPVVGNSHPLGFSFVLRAMETLGRHWPYGGLAYVYQVWQVGCFLGVLYAARPNSRVFARLRTSPRRLVSAALLALSAFALLVPGLVFFMNGYWSEMTALLVVALAAISIERLVAEPSLPAWSALALLAVVGWQIRYQLAIIPVAAALTILLARTTALPRLRFAMTAVIVPLLVMAGCNAALHARFPSVGIARFQMGEFLEDSFQCRLRCDVKLFEVGCLSRKGQRKIRTASCTDLHANVVDLGAPVVDPYDTAAIFRAVGFGGTLKWLFLAPATYFRERFFFLEHESFGIDPNIRILAPEYPYFEPYARQLPRAGARPARAFAAIVAYLEAAYGAWLFHVIAASSVLGSLVVVARRAAPRAAFLAIMCVLTYLTFSYFQPKAPLRYMLQIAIPGMLAMWLSLADTQRARDQPR